MKLEQSNPGNEKITAKEIDDIRIREITRKFVFDGHIGLDEKDLIFEIIKADKM